MKMYSFKEIEIAIETQSFITIPTLGLSFYGYGNINQETIFYGLIVSLQIGKLR